MPVVTVGQTPNGLYQAPAYDQPAKSVVITNLDSHNTLYYSSTPGTIDAQSSVIPPQYAETFDGSDDVWASTLNSSVQVQVDVKVGSTQLSIGVLSPATPLVQAGSVTGSPAATITAGGSFTAASMIDVSAFSSYDINAYITSQSPGAPASVICAQLEFLWFDDQVSGIPVFEEDWFIWSGRTAPVAGVNYLAGCGPMHGRFLTVNVFLPPGSAAGAVLQYFNLYGSSRSVPYSDWRQNGQAVNPQVNGLSIQQGGGTSFDNILASVDGVTVANNATIFIPCGLYSGPAFWRFEETLAATNDPILAVVAGTVGGQLVAGTSCPGTILDINNNANANQTGVVQLPRSPTALIVKAPGAGSYTFSFHLIAQQAA